RPESNFDQVSEYSQHKVDYLDLAANRFVSGHYLDLVQEDPDLPLDMIASRDHSRGATHCVLTFDGLLSETPYVRDMREILQTIERAYRNPVDIEFTTNFVGPGRYKVNLLQCRPLQVQGVASVRLPQVEVGEADRVIEARGAIVGPSRLVRVDRFIYVVPDRYGVLPIARRYEVARLLGRINSTIAAEDETTMLLGPGRWGTSSPELGVPVNFVEINRMSVLCEIVTMRENLVPDVSLGTHFLNELVEMNMLYMALFPQQQQNYLNERFFLDAPSRLLDLVPAATAWNDAVRVVETADLADDGRTAWLWADASGQEARVFLGDAGLIAEPASLRWQPQKS
ncbi:MAG: hypothetical protein KJZ87_27220, partial [Thermoguttaceae bacterium]|nr:hypothetical protein [Thermoguttaceae bacterium]